MSMLGACYEIARHAGAAWAGGGFCEGDNSYRAYEEALLRKYRHWRGRSGRSYAFSVYSPADCPAYVDTVVIVAARRGGDRQILACVDLGPFPDAWLSKLRRRFQDRLGEVEFHIHVLAEREVERRSVIDDLAPMAA